MLIGSQQKHGTALVSRPFYGEWQKKNGLNYNRRSALDIRYVWLALVSHLIIFNMTVVNGNIAVRVFFFFSHVFDITMLWNSWVETCSCTRWLWHETVKWFEFLFSRSWSSKDFKTGLCGPLECYSTHLCSVCVRAMCCVLLSCSYCSVPEDIHALASPKI